MKKRLISLITLVACLLSACFAFVACGGNTDDGGKPSDSGKTTYAISKTEVSLEVGEETTLTVTATPEKQFTVQWSVDHADVASVDNGKVTALAEGTAKVTAKVDGKELTCTVTVTEGSVMYIYTLNESTLTLDRGEQFTLTVDCQPTNPNVAYTWESSDAEVATVENGVVTAVAAGTATISVKAGGNEVASCDVTVVAYSYTVTEELTVDYGTTDAKINVAVTPEKETAYTFTVDTAGQSVISVDENGNITTLGVGTATVTVKDGEKTVGTCSVTVAPVAAVQSALKLHTEDTATLTVTILPEGGDNEIAFEVTEGDDVVSVTQQGVVTALKVGTAKIKTTVDGVESYCDVTVADAFVTACTIAELDKGSQDDAIDLTAGAEYWEQYIAKGEVNHKQYADPEEDVIENIFPVTNNTHYLSDYQAWLSWNGGATPSTCSCGKCNKDTQNGGDGGWTGSGTKAYFSHENGTGGDRRDDLLNVKHVFNIKVFPGASTIKIYTGSFKATVKADVIIGTEVLATQTFTNGNSKADLLTVAVDVKDVTVVKIEFVITEFPNNENGFITFAGASVSGPVYRLSKTSTQLLNNATENIVVTKDGETVTTGITYASSDESIVTVDADGTLTPGADGDAIVTVTVDGRVRKLAVKVGYDYEIDATSVSLLSGQTHQITLTSLPAGSTQTATYTSNGTGIATVSDTGLITAVAEGETTVDVEIGVYTYHVTVVVSKAAVTVTDASFRNAMVDLTVPEVIYWEYYLFNEITSPTNLTDIVEGNLNGIAGEENGYGAFIYFTNGNPKTNVYDDDAFRKYSKGSLFQFTINMPAGHHEIRLYTGAWENTVNKTSLSYGDKELASVTLAKEGGGRSTLVTFDTTTAETVPLKLKVEAVEGDNCRLMALAIVDVNEIGKTPATTTVTFDESKFTEIVDNTNKINLSETGNLDWTKFYVEQTGGSSQGNSRHIVKKTENHLIGELSTMNYSGIGWDYKTAITWNDGDGEVNSGDGKDGDYATGEGHNNFIFSNGCEFDITVDQNVKTVTLYLSGYESDYALAVFDSHGNTVCLHDVLRGNSGGSRAFAVTLNIAATAQETLTFRVFKTRGTNIGVAAIAVGGTAQAA